MKPFNFTGLMGVQTWIQEPTEGVERLLRVREEGLG